MLFKKFDVEDTNILVRHEIIKTLEKLDIPYALLEIDKVI